MTNKPKLTLKNSKTNITAMENITNATSVTNTNIPKANKTHPPNTNKLTNEEYAGILNYLQDTYPKAFPAHSLLPPLAVGIHKQLFSKTDLPYSRIKLRSFLKGYTRNREYRKQLIIGSNRVDLDGNNVGKVVEEEVNRTKWQEIREVKAKKANHDSLIKKAFQNPIIAQEFLYQYLPDEYKALIDLATIKVEKESFVEESLKNRLSDIVFSVQMVNQPEDKPTSAFIYTLREHQSYSDYWIALRLLKYSLLLLERHAKGQYKLPIILPLVIYNGKAKYKAPKNLFELFTSPDIARKALREDYNLIDLQAMDDNSIDYAKHLSFLLYTMKHIHERDTLQMLKNAMSRCSKAVIIRQFRIRKLAVQ